MQTPGRPEARPGARRSVLRSRRRGGAARRLAGSSGGAARRLAAACRRSIRAARGLASRGRRIRRARGRAVSAATPDRRAHQHSRDGRNCQSLRKVHSFFVSSAPRLRRASPLGSCPDDAASGSVNPYAPRLGEVSGDQRTFFDSASDDAPATASDRLASPARVPCKAW